MYHISVPWAAMKGYFSCFTSCHEKADFGVCAWFHWPTLVFVHWFHWPTLVFVLGFIGQLWCLCKVSLTNFGFCEGFIDPLWCLCLVSLADVGVCVWFHWPTLVFVHGFIGRLWCLCMVSLADFGVCAWFYAKDCPVYLFYHWTSIRNIHVMS